MVWDGASDRRERNYQAALDYYQENGDLNVPYDYMTSDGLHLGWWVKYIRKAYWAGKLDREQIKYLESIGMMWGPPRQDKKPTQVDPRYAQTASGAR